MPRFVLLHHKTPPGAAKPDHFDLMLEAGDVLKTYTVWKFPTLERPVPAIADFDHRLAYLDYEGPVSRGRGEVSRAESGTYEWIAQDQDEVTIEVRGQRLRGTLTLKLHSGSESTASG